jgi:hypothetical protein
MPRSPSTKPYVVLGPKGKTFKTERGLLGAVKRAGGENPFFTTHGWLEVTWPMGMVAYRVTDTDTHHEVEQQLGYDL